MFNIISRFYPTIRKIAPCGEKNSARRQCRRTLFRVNSFAYFAQYGSKNQGKSSTQSSAKASYTAAAR